jgi:hypothetical protein
MKYSPYNLVLVPYILLNSFSEDNHSVPGCVEVNINLWAATSIFIDREMGHKSLSA